MKGKLWGKGAALRPLTRMLWAGALVLLAGALAGCPSQKTTVETGPAASTGVSGTTAPATTARTSPAGPVKEVSFNTADGWTIVGDLYTPTGTSQGTVILLHQRSGAAGDWQPLCQELQKAGLTALAIDLRGAGRSTQGPGPTGDNAPWDTTGDIAAAINSLPGKRPVCLAGASYGANNALIYAAAHPDQVKGLALFSPGANYHGLDALAPARQYRGPLIIFHAQNDNIADGGPQQINNITVSTDHTLMVISGSGHGTQLLQPDVIAKAVAFFTRVCKS